jgi:polyhydroxyalkanoate synthesis regulator phasin
MLFLYEPVEKSFKVMEETLEQLSKEGKKMPQASKEYYQLWIKILEEHFMTIFKSPAYGNILNETLCKLEEFLVAKDGILQDFLRVMPVPTNNEMDELYKEIHTLKKRVKEMENKNHKRQKKPDKD